MGLAVCASKYIYVIKCRYTAKQKVYTEPDLVVPSSPHVLHLTSKLSVKVQKSQSLDQAISN